MSDFTDIYTGLLILQYADKPKAVAHIKALADEWEKVYDFARSFETEFDLSSAWGDRLDKIGAIVGRSRIVEKGYAKTYFGFDGITNAKTFGKGPFFRILKDSGYAPTVLNDTQYRFFIKAKILKNTASPRLATIDSIDGLQKKIDILFSSMAHIVDNLDMTMTLYVSSDFDLELLDMATDEDLLPSPQGVRYTDYVEY